MVWAFAESTLFVIVPDVLLTAIAARDRRIARRGVLCALIGAGLGGMAMYTWEHHAPGEAFLAVAETPDATPALLHRAQADVMRHGPMAIVPGCAVYVPFKVYAVTAEAAGASAPAFLACALAGLAVRFTILTAVASWIAARLRRSGWTGRRITFLHAAAWISVYIFYMAPLVF